MRSDLVRLGGLVKSLDDSRWFCGRVSAGVVHPPLKHLLVWVGRTHQEVADELCGLLAAAGRAASRRGHRLRACRVAWSRWLAGASLDLELAYAEEARRRGARLLTEFRGVLRHAHGANLRGCLVRGARALEYAQDQVVRLAVAMSAPVGADATKRHAARVPAFAATTFARGGVDGWWRHRGGEGGHERES